MAKLKKPPEPGEPAVAPVVVGDAPQDDDTTLDAPVGKVVPLHDFIVGLADNSHEPATIRANDESDAIRQYALTLPSSPTSRQFKAKRLD